MSEDMAPYGLGSQITRGINNSTTVSKTMKIVDALARLDAQIERLGRVVAEIRGEQPDHGSKHPVPLPSKCGSSHNLSLAELLNSLPDSLEKHNERIEQVYRDLMNLLYE